MESKKFSAKHVGVLSKGIMQPEQVRCIADQHDKNFGVIVIWNADGVAIPSPFNRSGMVLPCPTTSALPFNARNLSRSAPISFAGTTVGVKCAALAVGVPVSCVRLNSVTKTDVMYESFRICANAFARFCPSGDKLGSLSPVLAFSAWRTMKIIGAASAPVRSNNRGIEKINARLFHRVKSAPTKPI